MEPSRFLRLGCVLALMCSAGCAADGGASPTFELLDAPSLETTTTTSTTVEDAGDWSIPVYGYPCEAAPYPGGSTTEVEAGLSTFAPVQWGISLDDPDWGPGVHTVYMVVEFRPGTMEAMVDRPSVDVTGRLVWDETVVELCGVGIRCVGEGYFHVGDILQTVEGCGDRPTAMQDAFDEYGLPTQACLSVGLDDADFEYCAPLS